MPLIDKGSATNTGRSKHYPSLGPLPVALFTIAAVLAGAFLVDVFQYLLVPKMDPDTRHLVTILCCAMVAANLAFLAVRRGEILVRNATQDGAIRQRLEAELGHILDSVRLFLWHATVVEVDGDFIWEMHVSHEEAAKRILPIAVLPGRTWSDSWYGSKLPEDAVRSDESSLNAFRNGSGGYHNEYRCRLASGEIRWFYEDVLIERLEASKFYVMGACVDITQLKEAEASLEAERALLRTVMNSLPDPVFVKDRSSRFVLDNLAHLNHLGVATQADLNGKTDFDLFPKDIARPFFDDEQRIILGEREVINHEEVSLDREGESRWFWTTKVPLRDQYGAIVGIVGVNRDVTDRKRDQEELRKARDEALASTRAKSEFLANMSHEIRTPMNGILGITELMLGTNLTDEQYELACTVRSSGDALLTVINDILDFSRIEAGKMTIEVTDFNLRTIAEEVTDLVAGNAFGKGLELACLYETGTPEWLQGDPARIRQILTNLMGNAVKFTHSGEVSLEIRLLEKDNTTAKIRMAVVDTGIGVSQEAQARIFESFTQADGTTTRKYGGTGLGLAICKQLANLMGGEIGVESKEGQGSTFTFDVTLGIHVGKDPEPHRASREKMDGLRVLIVDDNATNRQVLREQLSSWGCDPHEVTSPLLALAEIAGAYEEGAPFKVAILDMQMPEMDGVQLGARIRADARFDKMPMILYTSIGESGGPDVTLCQGFSVVLMKPARQSQLLTAMLNVLGERQSAAVHNVATANDSRKPLDLQVLLAEDNEINQMVAKMMLERFGCKTDTVETGRLAVEAMQTKRYDIVLMDVHMPEMDGYEATSQIRELEQPVGHHTAVIAMTAKAMAGDRELCIAAGMDDYIVKPVKPDDLYAVLLKWGKAGTN